MEFIDKHTHENIKNKILRNNISIKIIEYSDIKIKKEILIKAEIVNNNKLKSKLLKTINSDEEKQMIYYDKELEIKINSDYEMLSELTKPNRKIIKWMNDIDQIDHEIINHIKKIEQLNNIIPEYGMVTNYKVKRNFSENVSSSCSTEDIL